MAASKFTYFLKPILFSALLYLFLSSISFADDVGKYYIQLTTCTNLPSAQAVQQKVIDNRSMSYIDSLNLSTTVTITKVDNKFNVTMGLYPTLGEARNVARIITNEGFPGIILQVQPPLPDINSITGSADEIYSKATAFYKAKQYAMATVYFSAFNNLYPDEPRYFRSLRWIGYADILLNAQKEAIKAFQIVANSNSDLAAEAQLRVSYLYVFLNDLDNAKISFEKVVSRFSNTSSAIEAQQQLSKLTPTSQDDELIKSAGIAISVQNYSKATALLSKYIQTYPAGPKIDQAYYQLGLSREKVNDKSGALKAYTYIVLNPNTKYAGVSGVQLANVALSTNNLDDINSAIESLHNSPHLSLSNQTVGGLLQTHIGYLYLFGVVPKTPGGQLNDENSTISQQSACRIGIDECHKVRALYPNADRYDLARSFLMEIEGYCRFDNKTTVIEMAKQLLDTYPDQRKSSCYAQFLIGSTIENMKDYLTALQAYQTLLDKYTMADNITTSDDLIAMALYRKSQCLIKLNRKDEACPVLNEIVTHHNGASMIVVTNHDIETYCSSTTK